MPARLAVVDPHRVSRSAPLVAALSEIMPLVGTAVPQVARSFDVRNKLRHVHPTRDTWRARAFFNGARFEELSKSAARQLSALPDYDTVLHVYPILCGLPAGTRYVVLTDNTMAVTQRSFRRWASLTTRETAGALAREAEVLRGAAHVATWGTQARASVVEDYGCDPQRVVAVGYGVALPGPEPVDRPDGENVLFVATSFWRKGGATLLEAWTEVIRERPDARLAIVGPRHRPPRGLHDSISWVGPQRGAELAARYASANVFVLPTLFESSLPNVIREAMSFNLPVVASDVAGIANDAPPGVVLFPTGDAPSLADRLVQLLRDPARTREVGLELRREVVRDFSWTGLAIRVAALLESAAAPPRRP